MKEFYIFIVLLMLMSPTFAQDLNYSISRNDNDYVTYKDNISPKEANPKIVSAKFQSIIDELNKDISNIQFFSFKSIYNEDISIYSLLIDYSLVKECYVIAYSKKRDITTNNPIILNVKWSFNNESGFNYKLLEYPFIGFKQIDNNLSICLKERVHNGNMYNAVINRIYKLNEDLSFDLKFCYEEVSLIYENQIIKRFLNGNFVSVYLSKGNSYKYLGKVELNFKEEKIIKVKCNNGDYRKIIFTSSGRKDEDILKNGYTINY